jgi:predicted nucleic acid-binding protein
MTRAFIDASVLFAASLSPTGASREIIRQAVRGEVALVASRLVFEETEENLADKAPEALSAFHQFLDTVPRRPVCRRFRQGLPAIVRL